MPALSAVPQARRRRLTHRAAPLAGIAFVALVVGIVAGANYVAPERKAADRFARAWQRGDYRAMYAALDDRSKAAVPRASFEQAYRDAATMATLLSLRFGRAHDPSGGTVTVPVRVRTRIFGSLSTAARLPFHGERLAWTPSLAFPGLRRGETLSRRTQLPPRAAILAANGKALARGPDRASEIGASTDLVGSVDVPAASARGFYRALGYPDDAKVGISGLERALEGQLAGTPGGTLVAGGRVLATSVPRVAPDARTTIEPRIEAAAASALGGRLGGIAVMRPASGEVLALAGIALDGLQPPGSTFKIITTTAALEDHKVKLTDTFPVETAAVLSGVSLSNASGESCGGTFVNSFAESCNSVFAPLGVKVGAARLVETARRYGFDEPPSIPGAAESSIPPADEVGDDLAVGSTAIGQGKVLATTLQMTSIAATIGQGGLRAQPTLLQAQRPRVTRVTSPSVARTIRGLMVQVVRSGTGTNASLPGVTVAGKTGTAELGGPPGADEDPNNSDAWFVAFAPAQRPRVAVGVLVVKAGAGGDFAAPLAAQVLPTALARARG
jgi:cell division protein FtsI/penicillin-binding protein 2